MDWGLAQMEGREDSHDIRLRSSVATLSEVRTDRKEIRESDLDSPLVTRDGAIVGVREHLRFQCLSLGLGRVCSHRDVEGRSASSPLVN